MSDAANRGENTSKQGLCDKRIKRLCLVSDMVHWHYVESYVFGKHGLTYIPAVKSQDFPFWGAPANCCKTDCSVCKRLFCCVLVLWTLLFCLQKPFSPHKTFYLVLVTENYTYKHSYSSNLLLYIFYSAVAVFSRVVKEVCGKGYYSGGGKLDFCTRCDQSTWKPTADEVLLGSARRNASALHGRLLAQIQAPPWDKNLSCRNKIIMSGIWK